jgi:hypothetical protein
MPILLDSIRHSTTAQSKRIVSEATKDAVQATKREVAANRKLSLTTLRVVVLECWQCLEDIPDTLPNCSLSLVGPFRR